MKLHANNETVRILKVVPALAVIVLFFGGGIVFAVVQSFGGFAVEGPSRWTWEAYEAVWETAWFLPSLAVSLRTSVLATLFSAFIAAGLALMTVRAGRFWRGMMAIPLGVPHLVAAVLIVLLWQQSGGLARLAYALGWIDAWQAFPIVTNESFGWGIILAYVWKEVPFLYLFLLPVLQRIRAEWYDVAQLCAATKWTYGRTVVLPLMMPSLAVGSFIVFAYTFGAFEVPYVLGVTYPASLAVVAYDLYTGDWSLRPQAMVVACIQATVPLLVGLLLIRLFRRSRQQGIGW